MKVQKATFACGCFWCTEAIYKKLRGVSKVIPGYSGGDEKSSYEEVSSGTTGHAEAVQVEFNPDEISYKNLLFVFFRTHDPTTKDRQGGDVGHQYRSVILYRDESQKKQAQEALKKAQRENKDKVVTEIVPFTAFYEAEDYHKDYYLKNKNNSYCRLVIDPKIKNLEKNFKNYLKKSSLG